MLLRPLNLHNAGMKDDAFFFTIPVAFSHNETITSSALCRYESSFCISATVWNIKTDIVEKITDKNIKTDMEHSNEGYHKFRL